MIARKLKAPRSNGERDNAAPAARAAPDPTFARHETFAPRFGWLKKGYDAAVRDPLLFSRDDAALELGVGKNMARSIRYWALACGILSESTTASGRSASALRTTQFGDRLLGPNGWDPFLEDLGSLWLLHWRLLRYDGMATAWRYAYNEFAPTEFSVDDLANALGSVVQRRYPAARIAASSLRKDAACIVQMYAGVRTVHDLGDESIHSPFTQLELMGGTSNSRQFSFRHGAKPGLSAELVGALCVDFMLKRGNSRSVPLTTLLRGNGSPGQALRLSEGALYAFLDTTVRNYEVLRLSDTAGIAQLSVAAPPDQVRLTLLDAHFAGSLAIVEAHA